MEIVRTKIIIPKRRSDLLSRPRLLQLFHNLDEYKLSILTAPPGYGKTSLLIDAAHTLGVPFCWYTLDALDQDTTRFLTHFIASIKQRFKRFGQQSLAILENARSDLDIDQLITVLTNEIYETISGRFIVAIDDYHLVDQNQEINYFVNQFTQYVGDNCHLAISSRVILPLPDLSLFIVRGQANGISFEELAFNKSEIQLLMLRNHDTQLTDGEADSLYRETEGWITGLLLSSQVQQQHEMVDRLRLARASGIGLYDYLADQVLNQQPEPVREFLLQSSLLEEFNAALCERVYGSHQDWPQLITTLLQTNLFVIPVENDDGLWIRYHHLFQEFLRNRMEQQHRAKANQIRQRLAEIYMEQEQWERAYDLYRQMNDTPRIVDLIKRANYSLLKNGHQATLVKWIDALDDFRSEPEIMALRGFLTINFGQNGTGPNTGLLYLDRAVEALRHSPVKLSQVLIWRARVNYVRANYTVSLQDIDKALELLSTDGQTNLYVDALRYKGMNLIDLGRPAEAIALLETAASVSDETTFSYINMALGIAYENTGSYEAAKRAYNKALAYWNETHNGPLQAFVLNNIAVIHHYSGNYVDAAFCLEQSIYYSRQCGNKHSEATAVVSLCDLYKDLDISTEIIEALEKTQELVTEIGDMFLQFYIYLLRAFAQKANPEAQLASLSQARVLAEASNSNYQLGLYKRVAGQLVLATQPQQAISLLTSAIEEHFDQTHKVELAVTTFFLAIGYKIINRDELATFYLQKTLELAKQLESRHLLTVSGRSVRPWLESFLDYDEFRPFVSTHLQKIDDFDENIPRLKRLIRQQISLVPFSPPDVVVKALGKTEVKVNNFVVTSQDWRTKAAHDMFFCLLAHPNGLSKDEIGEILWPESSPEQLNSRFKDTIKRLRRAVGNTVIVLQNGLYSVSKAIDYDYDVANLWNFFNEAEQADNEAQSIKAYKKVVDLYAGSYAPDIDETWAVPERERLLLMYQKSVLNLAEFHLKYGEYELVLDYCFQALESDPCLERAHRTAMKAYAGLGYHAAITRQYEYCKNSLSAQLDVAPSEQTEALYQALIG